MKPEDIERLPTRTAILTQAAEDIDEALKPTQDGSRTKPLFTLAYRRMSDTRPGTVPGTAYDDPRVSQSMDGSPPPRGALAIDMTQPDRTELEKRIKRLGHDAKWIRDYTTRWGPKRPTNRDRALAAALAENEPGCSRCAKVGRFDTIHCQTDGGGILEETIGLCRWEYDFLRKNGRLASDKELRRHHEGAVVRVPV